MNLDGLFDTFANTQTIIFCLGVGLIIYMVRTLLEYQWPSLKTNRWWREIALPFSPILLGIALTLLAKNFPFPAMVQQGVAHSSLYSKFTYGGICGVASGWVFSRFRSWLASNQVNNLPEVPPSDVHEDSQ